MFSLSSLEFALSPLHNKIVEVSVGQRVSRLALSGAGGVSPPAPPEFHSWAEPQQREQSGFFAGISHSARKDGRLLSLTKEGEKDHG